MLIVDGDSYEETNLNRQIFALHSTLGMSKCETAEQRMRDINPELDIVHENRFFLPPDESFLNKFSPDIVVDAIDTVTAKIFLAEYCYKNDIPLVSCMGCGNRVDPLMLRVGTLEDTKGSGCAMSRIMRRELSKRNIASPTVVYSVEQPRHIPAAGNERKIPPATISFVPESAGCILASAAVKIILKE
jgi:tRNA A37 threonylcarbamoyladenosine dehydratase